MSRANAAEGARKQAPFPKAGSSHERGFRVDTFDAFRDRDLDTRNFFDNNLLQYSVISQPLDIKGVVRRELDIQEAYYLPDLPA